MTSRKDDYYIRKVIGGDASAFAPLVERYKDMVFTLAVKMLRDREEAEEVAQDVFVTCYCSLSTFKGRSKFSTWLYKIVYHRCLDVLRGKKKYVVSDDIDAVIEVEEKELNALQQIVENDRNEAIRKAVRLLPEEDQVLIWMYYFDELTVKEIAKVVHLSEANVKVKLFRSRKFLYRLLQNNSIIRE
ncbi:RNA polymerase sigma factor [Sinomicrobium weinanense]|uniref:Sigma-70 family RNA polymerase sigma factor n=1 Tax=Sinomicrobium weinanense TaxID=2842200 RepID=A0A926JNU8_9FLAO|nr:sigma-70 family RNA polymerase sigma factor [Sinomicrobium weinanense]MBC9794732.1 sigma-70 family RNA polymerase sigma factor [Sinomicrobium weinanense]MBU3124991.1 sigma-70 family RNA polymerase sigma factor [Sinomicrobium weinanense]